jgi:hypothetical protein
MLVHPLASTVEAAPESNNSGTRLRRFLTDPYTVTAGLIFLFMLLMCWETRVAFHEQLYLLGSRRVHDPSFLAHDFTWAKLPATTALYDYMLAPLWALSRDGFLIVVIGRLICWGLLAWSMALFAREIGVRAWALFAGFAVWLVWGQTIAWCGSMLEGFQPKSFSYPLIFFALVLLLRGRMAWAGAAAGLATAFHIIVGGWALLGMTLTLLIRRPQYSLRQIFVFLAAAAPFIVPLVGAVVLFHSSGATAHEKALMDQIYVRFAMPHCCDVDYYMLRQDRWLGAGIVFVLTPLLVFAWPRRREAKFLGTFLVALIGFFMIAVVAQRLSLDTVLKVYPGQLGSAFPALFVFIFIFAWMGSREAIKRFGWAVWILVLAGGGWLVYKRDVLKKALEAPDTFLGEVWRGDWPRPQEKEELLDWIRDNTPKDAVFVTSTIYGFWPVAERAQIASMRHPPLDRRLIEWQQRLIDLNRGQPFVEKGFRIGKQLEANVDQLSVPELIALREKYGATHYMMKGERPDLAQYFLFAAKKYSVYDLRNLTAAHADSAAGGG